MEMKISIVCVIALLATSISTAEVPDYGLYGAGEGTPIFTFQPVLRNLQRGDTHDDSRVKVAESSDIIEEIQENKGENDHSGRLKREADPGDDQEKGQVEINVNRERGQGTRVDATVSRRVWESRDGNGRVDVHGNYGRTYGGPGGTGRPNYGGHITYSHRFRRSLQPSDEDRRNSGSNQDQGRGSIDVNVDRQRGEGTRVDVHGSGRVWESRDGNGRVDVHGNYGRTYGGPGGTGRPNYGGRITYSHRFRRSQQPRDSGSNQDQGRGSIDVNVDRQRGQGTRVDVQGSGRVWETRDGNGRVDVHGNYGRTYGGPGGTGRPNYGGRITYTHRFRRDTIVEDEPENSHLEANGNGEENDEVYDDHSSRTRREANPQDNQDRGRFEVDVNRERGQGTRVDARATGKVWESRDGNGRVDVEGNYGRTYGGPGGTSRPNYGGRIRYSHRFRRSQLPRDSGSNQDQGRGNIDVNVDRQRGQGTRVDVTGTGRVWESRDGNGRVDVHGNYGRTYGGPGGTSRPNYGGRITYSHRFRRSLQPRDDDRRESNRDKDEGRGSIDVNVDRQRGQGTRVDVTGTGRVWESRDGNGRVEVQGNYGRTFRGPGGTGRPEYGGRITYTHRFRRYVTAGDEQDYNISDANGEGQQGV